MRIANIAKLERAKSLILLPNPRSRISVCFNTIEIFVSVSDAIIKDDRECISDAALLSVLKSGLILVS